MFEYFKKYLIYVINIIFSTLKIKELIDSSSQKLYYYKLLFCSLHLIISSLSFSGKNIIKILTFVTHIIAVILINFFEWSKLRQITFDIEILKKFFYELVFFINILIIFDLKGTDQKKVKYEKRKNNQIEKNNNKDIILNIDKKSRNSDKKKENKENELLNESENLKQKKK